MKQISLENKFYDAKPLLELEIAKYRLSFSTKIPVNIKSLTPVIRSRLGYILKGRFCPFQDYQTVSCKNCSKASDCLYIKLFSPTLDSITAQFKGNGRSHSTPPRPYSLDIILKNFNSEMIVEDTGQVELTLIGRKAIQYQRPMLESIFHAMASIHTSHFLRNVDTDITNPFIPFFWEKVIPFNNDEIQQIIVKGEDYIAVNTSGHTLEEWVNALPLPESKYGSKFFSLLDIKLRTPFQLERIQEKITFTTFLQSILSRLRDLKRIYHPDNDMGDFPKTFYEKSDLVSTFSNLEIVNYSWYSHAQKKNIHIGGLIGDLIFKGDIEPFLSLLAAGSLIGIGKKTVYGLGRFEIV
ncbi:MAG: CRISPR system precrRNA processing endoribonuclease RAMP protein Cas6 [Desulfobacterales bacterium]|nr:CRISPR system precrRNA processing endoribonuclease RAMP protein Cas6 [Desulfobacterales bacterium]